LLKKIVTRIIVLLFLMEILILTVNIKPVKTEEYIYISADGSISPETAPIQRNGDVYTFTDNIYGSISVARSDIIIDGNGYTLQSGGEIFGFDLFADNVTVKNTTVKGFTIGFSLSASYNILFGNNITANYGGITIHESSNNNNITANHITNNVDVGVWLFGCSGNSISGNNITNNDFGVWLSEGSSGNSISGNNITNNGVGINSMSSNNNEISGNSITANGSGIAFDSSNNSNITANHITNNFYGIYSESSNSNNISGNSITANELSGVYLVQSSNNNEISGNSITNNYYGVSLSQCNNSIFENTFINDGLRVDYSYGNTIERNVINGKPLVYLEDVSNYTVDDAGQVILVNCDHIQVENLNLSHTSLGLELWGTNKSRIMNNRIATNKDGIYLYNSSDNIISGNNVTENSNFGIIILLESLNNIIYHNNFVNNNQVCSDGSTNLWDNDYPSGGNYWSDYTGVDVQSGPNQDQPGSDGIGDAQYVVDEYNQDRYPLMNPWIYAHNIAATNIRLSKTVAGQNYNVKINVTAANQGAFTETFNITLYANITSIATEMVILTSRNSTTVTFTWNTTGFAYGNYTIWAYAWSVQGETQTADNNCTDGMVYVGISGDINADGTVDVFDAVTLAGAAGSTPSSPNWNPNADINDDLLVDLFDAVLLAGHAGQTVS
jgi:parallel beta-helix repeat protein